MRTIEEIKNTDDFKRLSTVVIAMDEAVKNHPNGTSAIGTMVASVCDTDAVVYMADQRTTLSLFSVAQGVSPKVAIAATWIEAFVAGAQFAEAKQNGVHSGPH